ncbi:hypothetical protein DRP05_14970 [Archaeoglobales archaeon]|nr:MAG: hypothetical protein DRP05_14970 [Archaeoglobales archaeon]
MQPIVGGGKIFKDGKGSARIYIKKDLSDALEVTSSRDILLEYFPDRKILVVHLGGGSRLEDIVREVLQDELKKLDLKSLIKEALLKFSQELD